MNVISAKPEWAQSRREKTNAARIAAGLPTSRRHWPWVVLLLVIVLVAVASFVAISRRGAGEPTPLAEPLVPVLQLNASEVLTLTPQLLTQTVKVTGSLTPVLQADLTARVGGTVLRVLVRPGDAVDRGDTLLEIDTESLRIQLQQQRNTAEATRVQVAQAESQLERTRSLAERSLSSASALEQAEASAAAMRANLAALEAQVATAEIALANATVTAPFSGVVSSRSVEPDQTIGVGAPLVSLVDLSKLELDAAAPLSAAALIAAGDDVTIVVDGVAERSFTGTVERINPVAIAGTRSIGVYITLANPQHRLRGGMFATGQIVVASQAGAIAVPAAALREDAAGFHVLVIENDHLVRRGVVPGSSWNGGRLIEVTEGLLSGDVIVAAALPELAPGDAVAMTGS